MKVLWMSDSPTAPSGFGNVTRFVCAGLAELGHAVSILGWQTRGAPHAWRGCTVYPVRHDGFGADVLLGYLQKIQPDVFVTLADVWWLTYISNPLIANFMRMARMPWALYYPIDGDMGDGRLPPSWIRVLETVDLPIAMSQYGRDVARANGVDSAYVPHGVDTTLFSPPHSKEAAKAALGYEDRFVVLSDARNQPRKMLPRTLEIFSRFASGRRNVLLHLHCDPKDPAAATPDYSYDVEADVALLGLGDTVRTTPGMRIDGGVALERLAGIYQAADVHLLSSTGEGFGLPTLQAAAAGVVPLACDYTASRELVRGHGEPLPIRDYFGDQFGIRRALIDVDAAVDRLDALYRDPGRLREQSTASRRFAEAYDWGCVVPQWNELLRREVPRLRERLGRRSTSTIRLHAAATSEQPDMLQAVRAALPPALSAVHLTLNVVQSRMGDLAAGVVRDARTGGEPPSIPVALPSVLPAKAKKRVVGCVYVASAADVGVVQPLSEIFPNLNVWSTTAVPLGIGRLSGAPVLAKAVPRGSEAYTAHLAASTLALDLAGCDVRLPALAAELGVPCIGSATLDGQRELWPDLTMNSADVRAATIAGRRLLTDQCEAARVCAAAHDRLEAAPQGCRKGA